MYTCIIFLPFPTFECPLYVSARGPRSGKAPTGHISRMFLQQSGLLTIAGFGRPNLEMVSGIFCQSVSFPKELVNCQVLQTEIEEPHSKLRFGGLCGRAILK